MNPNYYDQQLSSILSTTNHSSTSRILSSTEIDLCKRILQEYPGICKGHLSFGHRVGYGVHSHCKVSPLLQLCYRQAPLELIQLAYDASPESLINGAFDAGDYTALHWACCGTFTGLEVVEFLVGKYPDALYRKSWGNRTCLHHACENSVAEEVVNFLLQKCPHHTQERDNHQNLPLHLACGQSQASFSVIKLLTDFDPSSVEARSQLGLIQSHSGVVYGCGNIYSGTGYTALHYACGEGATLDVVRLLVRLYPTALRLQGSAMALPLHLACARLLPSLDIIAFLTSQYPPALQLATTHGCSVTSGGGGTPLQLAAKSRPSLEVIQFLYARNPAAMDVAANSEHCLALQYACSNGASPDVIWFLLEQERTGKQRAAVETKNGETLLHATCYSKASHSLVPLILERFPTDVLIASNTGNLPLHAACEGRAAIDIVRLLASKNRKAIRTANNDGNLPLHLLVKRRPNFAEKMIDLNLLRYLVNENAEALNTYNHQKEYPIDLALSFFFPGKTASPLMRYLSDSSFGDEMKQMTPMEILRTLTPRLPAYQATINSSSQEKCPLPLHYVISCPPLAFREDSHLWTVQKSPLDYQEVVDFFFQQDPEACRRVNDLGELPLHVAIRTVGVSLTTIEQLFAKNPDAVQFANKDGLLPFQLAACRNELGVLDGNGDSDSLSILYFLVHRSLFAFKNLAYISMHDHAFSRDSKDATNLVIPRTSEQKGKVLNELEEDEFRHYLKELEGRMEDRILELERQIQNLKQQQESQIQHRKRQQEELLQRSDCNSSCCTIS